MSYIFQTQEGFSHLDVDAEVPGVHGGVYQAAPSSLLQNVSTGPVRIQQGEAETSE